MGLDSRGGMGRGALAAIWSWGGYFDNDDLGQGWVVSVWDRAGRGWQTGVYSLVSFSLCVFESRAFNVDAPPVGFYDCLLSLHVHITPPL